MREYQGFPISNFRTGFDQAVEPWLIPKDAWQVMKNAHLYRGVVEKINGYDLYAQMSYRTEIALSGVIDGTNKTFTGVLSPKPTTNNTIIQAAISSPPTTVETFTDDGTGTLTGSNGGTGSINYSNGDVTVTFGAAAPVNLTISAVQYNSVVLQYDSASPGLPIMGIKPYFAQNGSQQILIFDTRRVGYVVALDNAMATLQSSDYGITEIPHEVDALNIVTFTTAKTYTGTLAAHPVVPGHVQFTIYTTSSTTSSALPLIDVITDNGDGGLVDTDSNSLLDPTQPNYINYVTGQFILTFKADTVATWSLNSAVCIYGNIFTGTFQNFFSLVNYTDLAFFTNAIDPPFYYDGSCVHYLNTNLEVKYNVAPPYDLTKILHFTVQRDRLLALAPYVDGVPSLNYIYWSTAFQPLNWTNDEFLPAPTSQSIRAYGTITTDLIVRFSNSERIFKYTADNFSPFRWDTTNSVWRCDAPFSSINYDKAFSSVGQYAIVGSDGVNVQRVDEIIPDFTLNQRVGTEQMPVLSIDQTSIQQCYGERFDDLKEGWLCYKSYEEDNTGFVQPSDSILAFNYLDNTYAVYTFPFSVLGFGRVLALDTWGNNFDLWGDADYAWSSYQETENALINLGGDQFGNVFEIGHSYTLGTPVELPSDDPLNPVLIDIISMNFNPYIEQGQLARLGYVDLFLTANSDTTFRVQFYINDQITPEFNTFYQETILMLPGNGQGKVWKRIYVGATGKSHTIRIYQNVADFTQIIDGSPEAVYNQPFLMHAMVPYFKPAGRIFQ